MTVVALHGREGGGNTVSGVLFLSSFSIPRMSEKLVFVL